MVKHFCDKCGKDITEPRWNIYTLIVEPGNLFCRTTYATLCKNCVQNLRKWLKQEEEEEEGGNI